MPDSSVVPAEDSGLHAANTMQAFYSKASLESPAVHAPLCVADMSLAVSEGERRRFIESVTTKLGAGGKARVNKETPPLGTDGTHLSPTGIACARQYTAYTCCSAVNVEHYYKDGETVSRETLYEKGLIPLNHVYGIKLLSDGELTRKVIVDLDFYSAEAKKKLEELSIRFTEQCSQ